MRRVNIAIVGFGVVGSGVVDLLNNNKELIKIRSGIDINLKYIIDKDLLRDRGISYDKNLLSDNLDKVIEDKEIDIIVELVGGTDFAYDLQKRALENGKHIVTANKALLATKGEELFNLAKEKNREIGFEASVAGGIPIIKTIRQGLIGNRIHSIMGIINGTCNYILTKMDDENIDFKTALKQAQDLGFAEADPTLDINGGDASHKIAILASIAFNTKINYEEIYKEGIENVEVVDIAYARSMGLTLKLLGITSYVDKNKISVFVIPALISNTNPLASVKNEYNAVLINSDYLGNSMYFGKGAGMKPTASAVISDIVEIGEKIIYNFGFNINHFNLSTKSDIQSIDEREFKYYIRLNTLDKPGVLSKVAGILADNNISIAQVIQKDKYFGDYVHVVMITHQSLEKNLKKSIELIDKLDFIREKTVIYRVI